MEHCMADALLLNATAGGLAGGLVPFVPCKEPALVAMFTLFPVPAYGTGTCTVHPSVRYTSSVLY